MTVDIFAEYEYGKEDLRLFSPTSENFRLYKVEAKGNGIMKVWGAEFRKAMTGKYKGKLSIMIPGTSRTVYTGGNL